MTALPSAQPIDTHVFCEMCGVIHEADFDNGTLIDNEAERCIVNEPQIVEKLPDRWDRTHDAEYGENGTFLMFEKYPKLQPCHRPMYYLEEV